MAPDEERRRDHDLLVKTSELCKNTNDKLDAFIERIDARCESRIRVIGDTHATMNENINDKLSVTWFRWLVGILVTALIIVTGLVGANSVSISQLRIYMEDNSRHIEKHSDVIDELRKLSHGHDEDGS